VNDQRGVQALLIWGARAAAAAALVAVLELLFTALGLVAAASSVGGALQTWAVLCGLLGVFGAGAALLLWQLDRPGARRLAPSGASLLGALSFGFVVTLALGAIDSALYLIDPEFPSYIERMRALARVGLLALLVLLLLLAQARLRPWLERVRERAQRACGVAALAFGALLAELAGHFAFSPVHEVSAAACCSLLSLVGVMLALRWLDWPRRALDAQVLVGLLLGTGLLGAGVPGAARDHARFVVWGYTSAAGLAEWLRGALDRDHDAVLPGWLAGGGDCAPGEAGVSPLQLEVPGDGIDQDCRGGDAPRREAELGAAALPAGCSALPTKPDVLVIAIDALRFDALGPDVMPKLTELAKRSQFFSRAYSPTAMTITSVSSMFGARPFADLGPKNALRDEDLTPPFTAAERFAQAGYRTAAFSEFFDHQVFFRGFQVLNRYWRDQHPSGVKGELTSSAQLQGVLELLGRAAEPTFVWVHVSDTHAKYALNRDAEGGEVPERVAYYRGASYVDAQLGRLLEALHERGRLDRTVIAVMADHGEELRARGREGHGPSVFEESVHVPLVLWVPGCAPRATNTPVSLAHLMPTLGAFAGVALPGGSLFREPGPVVVESVTGLNTTYKRAVIGQRYKLLLDVTNGGRMLFDLQEDPGELTDILGDEPDQAAELERAYQRWLDAPGRR
jgi:hypothetical protein